MKKMNKKKFKKTYEAMNCMTDCAFDKFDALGSYTGFSEMNDKPTQDADDL